MLNKNVQFSFAYLSIFILQLISESDQEGSKLVLDDFHYLLKPSITISLMLYVAFNTQLKGRFAKRIFAGLLFGLFGDCFLMFVHLDSNFFILGLISFLIGHVLYITAFYLDYKWQTGIEKKSSWLAIITFGIFGISFYLYLRPYLNALNIPVMIYAFVIHMRYVPALRGKWIFNLMSMFAFISILFTYYGVNFHLVGLHSYASGEAKSLSWVWETIIGIAIIGAISYPKYRKYYKK